MWTLFLFLLPPVFSYYCHPVIIPPFHNSTLTVVACGFKMQFYVLTIDRLYLWLPSNADQMAIVNISKAMTGHAIA